MKTKFTLLFIVMCGSFFTAQAQEYNLFDAADVDENGWLWFDSQEKIDKYVGQADNDLYTVNPEGKIIQLVGADFDPYTDSTVDATVLGADSEGVLGGEGAKTGAIITAEASGSMSTDGGGFVVRMPSCKSFSIMLSGESKAYVRLLGTTDEAIDFKNYTVVSAMYASIFKPLFSGGQFTWEGMEELDNGNEPYFKLKSDGPITAFFQSLTADNLYIHGIRVITSTPSSIENVKEEQGFTFDGKYVNLAKEYNVEVYDITGMMALSVFDSKVDLSGLNKGVYVVKVNDAAYKVYIR